MDIYYDIIESDYICKKVIIFMCFFCIILIKNKTYNTEDVILFEEQKKKVSINSVDLLLYMCKL